MYKDKKKRKYHTERIAGAMLEKGKLLNSTCDEVTKTESIARNARTIYKR